MHTIFIKHIFEKEMSKHVKKGGVYENQVFAQSRVFLTTD